MIIIFFRCHDKIALIPRTTVFSGCHSIMAHYVNYRNLYFFLQFSQHLPSRFKVIQLFNASDHPSFIYQIKRCFQIEINYLSAAMPNYFFLVLWFGSFFNNIWLVNFFLNTITLKLSRGIQRRYAINLL